MFDIIIPWDDWFIVTKLRAGHIDGIYFTVLQSGFDNGMALFSSVLMIALTRDKDYPSLMAIGVKVHAGDFLETTYGALEV